MNAPYSPFPTRGDHACGDDMLTPALQGAAMKKRPFQSAVPGMNLQMINSNMPNMQDPQCSPVELLDRCQC